MRALGRGLAALGVLTVTIAGTVAVGGVAQAAPPSAGPAITSGPAAGSFSNQTSATFTFTHANTSATFTCQLDGGAASACTSPKTYTGLKAGSHTFSVRAIISGQKPSKPTTRTWTVDLTAPNAPTVSQPTSPTKNTTASITFSSTSTDVLSYRCSLDGAAASTCTSPKALSSLADGYHTFTVWAVDRAGNQSTGKTVQWAVDTQVDPPFITSGPASVSTGNVSFTFDNVDPNVTYTCSMDSSTAGSFTPCTSPKSYTGLSSNGPGISHTFRVKATDAVGNVSTATAFTWTVKNAPTISLSWSGGLPAPVTSSTNASLGFTATGQTTLACVLDGVTQGTCTSPASFSGLADGSHTFTLVADKGLASEVSFSYSWLVDTVAPTAPTITGPTGRVASGDASVTVTPAGLNDTVTCTVDSVVTSCSALSLTGLADGDHNVTSTASDAAGNTAQSSLDWTVDTTGPSATTSAPTTRTGPFRVVFDEDASGVDATSVLVTDEGGTPITTTQKCLDKADAATDCANTDVRTVEMTPSTAVMLGSHFRVQVNPVAAQLVADNLGNVGASVDDSVRAATSVNQSAAGATFTWRKVSDKKAKGGSYVIERRKGATASWTFSGRSVTWFTLTGPTQGKANVYVDGVRKATVNNYAKSVKYLGRTIKGLATGTHTVEVRVLGQKGSKKGKGTFVVIDGFKVGKKVTATPTLSKVAWSTVSAGAASGGTYTVADLKAQTMKVSFRGTGVTVTSARGPAFGKAYVYVDGVLAQSLDLYASSLTFGYDITVTGLTDGVHTVLVKVLGSKSPASTGTGVVVDQITVL
jgi:hypothetical protein